MKRGRAEDLVRQVEARRIGCPTMRCAGAGLGATLPRGLAVEQRVVGQLPVARPRAVRADDVAVLDA